MKNIYKNKDMSNITNINLDERGIIDFNITCCNQQNFKVFSNAKIVKGIFGWISIELPPDDKEIYLYAQCEKCHEKINIFNGYEDGYDNWCDKRIQDDYDIKFAEIKCSKCNKNDFFVKIKLEYNDEDYNKKINQKFEWIYVDLICNNCGKKYRKILSKETG